MPDATAGALLPTIFENIPQVLRAQDRWAPWRAKWNAKRGKHDKVPVGADGRGISTARERGWMTFDAAVTACADLLADGVGYRMTGEHGIVGIDMDRCVKDGVLDLWAAAIAKQCGSYTEVSPSGNGLRVFVTGTIPTDWTNHERGIEVYAGHAPRFLTVTGQRTPASTDDVGPAPAGVLDSLAIEYAKRHEKTNVIDIGLPEFDAEPADISKLQLSDKVRAFLTDGTVDGDRSATLFSAGIALYGAGLSDATVLSTLRQNPHSWEVALDHRGQDEDRATLYLWREHCLKARAKLASSVAGPQDFSVVLAGAPGGEGSPPAPPLPVTRTKAGKIEPTAHNLRAALLTKGLLSIKLAFDDFTADVMFAKRDGEWQPFTENNYFDVRLALEKGPAGFAPIGEQLLRAAIRWAAEQNRMDSARTWMDTIVPPWDGVPRIETFLSTYFGAEDTPYTRACSRMLWTSLAGRAIGPTKADGVVILVGKQGIAKSLSIEAMAPAKEYFTEINLAKGEDDIRRQIRGRLVGEMGELKGMRAKEITHLKSFVTAYADEWIPKYMEKPLVVPRRIVFIGSTNDAEFLHDDTGERRWFPVDVKLGRPEEVARDRLQLYAEAAARFTIYGTRHDYQAANDLAGDARRARTVGEVWEDSIAVWLATPDDLTGAAPATRKFLQTREIAQGALRMEAKELGHAQAMRIGRAMRMLGYELVVVRDGARTVKAWRPIVTSQQVTNGG
jgi:predicted P-loop ATPase